MLNISLQEESVGSRIPSNNKRYYSISSIHVAQPGELLWNKMHWKITTWLLTAATNVRNSYLGYNPGPCCYFSVPKAFVFRPNTNWRRWREPLPDHSSTTVYDVQESLANAKVSARQQCVYEGPYSLAKKSTANQSKEHNVGKYIHRVTNNAVADKTGLSSFVQLFLPHKSAKSHEIIRKFELISLQGHPRSPI